MSKTISINAPAKVNLCLAVHYPPQDGYHKVDSVFQELDLCDVVRVTNHGDGSFGEPHAAHLVTALGTPVALECAVPGLDPADNLVFRALDTAEQACDTPAVPSDAALVIEVEKRIPAGGGLGGGSSDAAAMLKAYAQLVGIDPLDERIVAVARKLGADVAFFLYGGCVLMRGRGDIFERRLPRLKLPIVLMGDGQGMSTAAIYQAFDANPPAVPDADALARALEEAPSKEKQPQEPSLWSLFEAARLCANNLGPIACAQSERLQARLDAARAHPCVLNALVSGSGSTSFAICPDREAAERFAADIAPLCDWTHICA